MSHLIQEKKALSAIRTAEEVKKDLNATAGWQYGNWAAEKTEEERSNVRILYDEEKQTFFSRSVRNSQKENEVFKAGLEADGFAVLDLKAQKEEPKNKLPVAVKDGKWTSSEDKRVSEAKKTFSHADLCTVREFADLDEYMKSDRKYLSFDSATKEKNDEEKKAEFQKVVSDILSVNLTSSMFTDDYLSQNMAELFDYSSKLKSIPAIKKKYPQYFTALPDETRQLIEAREKVSNALSTVLTNHLILHGVTCMPDGDGIKFVKLKDVKSASQIKAAHRERQQRYEDSLEVLRKKLNRDTAIDTALAYAKGEQYSAETRLKDIEESTGANPEMYVLFQDEYKAAYAEIKKAAVFRDELRAQQKTLLVRYSKSKKESERTELNAKIRLNNAKISVLSRHMDHYREVIGFLNGDLNDISPDAASFLRDEDTTEEKGGIVKILRRIRRVKKEYEEAGQKLDQQTLHRRIKGIRIAELKKAGVEIPDFSKETEKKAETEKAEKGVDPLPEADEEIAKLTEKELEDKMELLDRQGMGESDLYYKYWNRLIALGEDKHEEELKKFKEKKKAKEEKAKEKDKETKEAQEEKEEKEDLGAFSLKQVELLEGHILHKKPVSQDLLATFLEHQVQGTLPKRLIRATKIANMDKEDELDKEKEKKPKAKSDASVDEQEIDDILEGKFKKAEKPAEKPVEKPAEKEFTPPTEEAIRKMSLLELEKNVAILDSTKEEEGKLKGIYLERIRQIKDAAIAEEEKKKREAEMKKIKENGGFTDKEVEDLKNYLLGDGGVDSEVKDRFIELYREDKLTKKLWGIVKLGAAFNSDSPIWEEMGGIKKEKKEEKKEVNEPVQEKVQLLDPDGSVVLKIGKYEHQINGTNCWCCSGVALLKQYMALSGNPLGDEVDQTSLRKYLPASQKKAGDIPEAVKKKLRKDDVTINKELDDYAGDERRFMGNGKSIGNVFEASDFFLEFADVKVNKMQISPPSTVSDKGYTTLFPEFVIGDGETKSLTVKAEGSDKEYTVTVVKGDKEIIVMDDGGLPSVVCGYDKDGVFQINFNLKAEGEELEGLKKTFEAQKNAFVHQVKSVLDTGNLVSILHGRHYRTIAGYSEEKGLRVLDSNKNAPDDDKWIPVDEVLKMESGFDAYELTWLSAYDEKADNASADKAEDYTEEMLKEISHNAYQVKGRIVKGVDTEPKGVDGVTTVSYVPKKKEKAV